MGINVLSEYAMSDSFIICCPKFNFEEWGEQELHFKDKSFIKVKISSISHIPVNIIATFLKTLSAAEKAISQDIILSSYLKTLLYGLENTTHYYKTCFRSENDRYVS